ncbi:MAG: amidohydrolase family protein [Candidatus Riflebacteria bacterium]|nr:amidohydrolase family protein [Candidatus Riflebacteria bacterium]
MKIDCHCHVFNNDCIPSIALLQSRLGIVIGENFFKAINEHSTNGHKAFLDNFLREFFLDLISLNSSFTSSTEKDNLLYLASHPRDFIRFIYTGIKSMPDIVANMMEKAPGIDIWVPLMMDTESAYEGDFSQTDFEEQKQIMMDITAKEKGRIMPFFAYDPRSRPIDSVKTAIERDGFVGVKLYPPMGFKPFGNDDHMVESRLDELYSYCTLKRDAPIPITAHCSWSDGIYSNRMVPDVLNYKEFYRDMANPSYWKEVLSKYSTLKLNLAHFGGASEWEQRSNSLPSRAKDKNWAETILQLMRDYKNVYTDLSFNGILVSKNGSGFRKALLDMIKGVEDRILLGSDWYMSGIQCDLGDYWKNFTLAFPELFDFMVGKNAIRFLQSEATQTFFPAYLNSRNGIGQNLNLSDCFNKEEFLERCSY